MSTALFQFKKTEHPAGSSRSHFNYLPRQPYPCVRARIGIETAISTVTEALADMPQAFSRNHLNIKTQINCF
ncbi:MAG: hypothetical protein B6I22_03110 [Desulfobacteraceae bacterium 4572_123]|nr:MAG: hypothetical protein B6I22_03110 [Desulfobacteraceae bacterium 4572_123]